MPINGEGREVHINLEVRRAGKEEVKRSHGPHTALD